MSSITVPAPELLQFCIDCFSKRGLPPEEARLVAENLIFANLRGVDSHGVIRLKVYCDRLRAGGFRLNVRPQIIAEDASTAIVDGQGGTGQAAARTAMNLALGKAASTGLALVTVRNSNHFGACAFYAMDAVKAGMIGFAATNTGATMAPTGGAEGRLGNNAAAVAVPAGEFPPIVLDMAMGAVAWGKIFAAQQEKRKIPTTWALDKHGVPTDDPNAAAHQGLIQPFGGYKGYGLSLMIDLLAGVLSGGAFSTQVQTLYKQIEIPSGSAHLCAAIRIDSFMPLAEFRQRVDSIIQLMRSCPRAPDVDRVYVPGEIEFETEQRRRAEGIPINPELQSELVALGRELGLTAPFPSP
jgi:LDH2 family malate/lactate/ureidoglycolate dehydrogenase